MTGEATWVSSEIRGGEARDSRVVLAGRAGSGVSVAECWLSFRAGEGIERPHEGFGGALAKAEWDGDLRRLEVGRRFDDLADEWGRGLRVGMVDTVAYVGAEAAPVRRAESAARFARRVSRIGQRGHGGGRCIVGVGGRGPARGWIGEVWRRDAKARRRAPGALGSGELGIVVVRDAPPLALPSPEGQATLALVLTERTPQVLDDSPQARVGETQLVRLLLRLARLLLEEDTLLPLSLLQQADLLLAGKREKLFVSRR